VPHFDWLGTINNEHISQPRLIVMQCCGGLRAVEVLPKETPLRDSHWTWCDQSGPAPSWPGQIGPQCCRVGRNYCLQSAVYACGSRELEYLTISLCDARVLEKPERKQSNWSFILVKRSGECLTQIGIFHHSLNTIYILGGY